jgi:alpha-tubulin suppressor-like RCC1 family protein
MGANHFCALVAGGVLCWGLNAEGQLGEGGTVSYSAAAIPVTGLSSGFIGVAAGGNHSCALRSDGEVWCWGANIWGELGDGSFEQRNTPVQAVGVPAGISALSSGAFHTCALTASGAVWCWGDDSHGQLGDGDASFGGPAPVPVTGLPQIAAISAGSFNTCALTTKGGIRCWGANEQGQLGDGTQLARDVPVRVTGFGDAPAVPALGTPGLLLLAATLLGVGTLYRRRRIAAYR